LPRQFTYCSSARHNQVGKGSVYTQASSSAVGVPAVPATASPP
jgi:hypothetical protein